jgi:hypothetical protein
MSISTLQKRPSMKFLITIPIVFVLLLTMVGCSIKLIADYDEIIDRYATDLQGNFETFLLKMERTAGTPDGTYKNNINFYEEMQGTLTSLNTRAQTIPKNEIITKQILEVQGTLEDLRKTHERHDNNDDIKKTGLLKDTIDLYRDTFKSEFGAIIKLQNSLKRGETVNSEK